MTTGESLGTPISYEGCVMDLLDEYPDTGGVATSVFACESRKIGLQAPCSFEAYRDEEGITCIRRGLCARVGKGLAQREYEDHSALNGWMAYRTQHNIPAPPEQQ